MKKIISLLLILATLISCFTVTTISASAEEVSTPEGGSDTDTSKMTYRDYLLKAYNRRYTDGSVFLEAQKKLGLRLMARSGGYALYCNEYTGEVIYENLDTKQILTTNPYNFDTLLQNFEGEHDPDESDTFARLLSQIEVSFVDNESNSQTFLSFVEAAARGQIVVKNMKNGVRVEYTMGRLNTTYLLPGVVLAEDFEENIVKPFEDKLAEIEEEQGMGDAYEAVADSLMTVQTWYVSYRYDEMASDITLRNKLAEQYPVFKPESEGGKGATLCLLDENSEVPITDTERVKLENYLKTYCPDFNYETLDEMHAQTGYRADVNETPVFRAALEYVLEPDGLSVRMPASSIRFDETKYTLQYVKILQFMGAGDLKNNDGYVFYPDGSGAIVEFKDFYNTSSKEAFTLSGTVYGEDFAYYDIDQNAKHSETIRVPVYGIVEKTEQGDRGFFAVLEDGDALADIATYFGGATFNFATAYPMVYPRPSDKYNLSEAISVADNKEMTIVSDKKYTGFYKLKYMMLFDEDKLTKAATETAERYVADYVGMAAAYRNYLVGKGTMKALTENEVQNGKLPLYIETLGSVETVKKILSIPVNVDVPLASFEDVKTMYTQLEKKNITNVNFKLTGYANGGLDSKYPEKAKWLKAVGGKSGFEDLQLFANEKGIGIYPEFEFSYAGYESGVSLKKHASRAVDDRYCSKQLYDPVYQEFDSYFDICISPASILELVGKFTKSYSKFSPKGISVSSLGGELNSDFNKDDPLNRQDAKDYVEESLALLNENYQSVLAEGGNIYSVEYLDHILNIPLDASKYRYESKAVPFLGMVLHGYVNYAGSVVNEAGDSSFQLLKSIENGALLYYMLIYQNSNLLKEDEELSKFYSVRFDIWFETIVDQYEMLNGAIGDLQLYNIVDHEFLSAERVPMEYELIEAEEKFNKALASDLVTQYNALVTAKRRDFRIMQTAKNLIAAAAVPYTAETLEADLIKVLGEKELLTVKSGNVNVVSDSDKALIAACLADSSFADLYNKEITVKMDRAAIEALVKEKTGKKADDSLSDAQIAIINAFAADYCTTDENADCELKTLSDRLTMQQTDFTDNSGRVVLVTYGKGDSLVHFVLNYNTYEVNVALEGVNGDQAFSVPSYGFRRINGTTLAN